MVNISVIVPVYKVEAFLNRCVDSILRQTYEDFEVILVDDGSPDNCGALCDAYARQDSRIHVIHQENGGLSAARNSGIDWAFANSTSRWLAFVDSDDWVHPDFLRVLYETAEQTLCKISACDFFRSTGEDFPEQPYPVALRVSADDYYCGEFHRGETAVAWNKLYHKSLFQHLRYPVGKLHEDEFTTYQAIYQAGQVGVTPMTLYAYYQNPGGIMKAPWSPGRMHMLEAAEQQIAFARERGDDRLLNKAAKQYVYGSYEQLNQAPVVFRRELQKKLRAALKLGQECGCFPRSWKTLWAYEAAYPCKPFWWLLSKVHRGEKGENS
ncbi:MAG: glycosyltransferase family 2 protein [Candidatus Faecousia sp.]|nr:glycosyltransferase family 2 protein [Candidatus Faecousia sp.]